MFPVRCGLWGCLLFLLNFFPVAVEIVPITWISWTILFTARDFFIQRSQYKVIPEEVDKNGIFSKANS